MSKLLDWFRGLDWTIDITPDPDTMAMIDQPAAYDKHRELLQDADDAAFIARCQARIIANGGTVHVVTPQEHAARLKERGR